ncbi:uncharacterized protein LOC123531362 [Mercenaria mercenaria]|uniref:uncharacterized protein LOC123531362 n=1 Tax=Mercenaria mercenaria TaxID=6596 RepID=UPI00234EDE10|nr:uncharacterized protein LOC123531362 [Mercenaria mercenaria]
MCSLTGRYKRFAVQNRLVHRHLPKMDQGIATVFFLLFQHCLCSLNDLRHRAPRTELLPHQFETLRHVAMIKQEILRHLGITDSPRQYHTTPTHKSMSSHETGRQITEYKATDVASYHSEPPDNFTDENIIQFKLFNKINGKQLEVNNVNLLVRVKLRKSKKDKRTERNADIKTKRRKRKKKFKEINLLVSNVTASGQPDTAITSVKSKIRKTKSLKLSIPKELIQTVLDSHTKILQLFIQCIGCDKKAKMILVHKRRKRKVTQTRGNKQAKLHKRRPILFVYSHVRNES